MAIFAHLQRLFSPRSSDMQAAVIYVQIVEQARMPQLYTEYGVPDTLDGRFEMIGLHLFLVLEAMKTHFATQPHWQPLSGLILENFFADMDRSLREMGVGDTGIKRRIKVMVSAFYGRMDAYRNATATPELWPETLARNVYAKCEKPPEVTQVQALQAYIQTSQKKMNAEIAENPDGQLTLSFAEF